MLLYELTKSYLYQLQQQGPVLRGRQLFFAVELLHQSPVSKTILYHGLHFFHSI
jgi:hypothetical protein